MYQQKVTAEPRLAREGFVPASPRKRPNRRNMLIPKTGHPTDHIPTLMDFSESICPPERRALREIVETAEVVRENGHVILVARVSSATLDSLATFGTSRADLEDGVDLEDGGDDEPSIGGGGGIGFVDAELDDSDQEYDHRNPEPHLFVVPFPTDARDNVLADRAIHPPLITNEDDRVDPRAVVRRSVDAGVLCSDGVRAPAGFRSLVAMSP